MRRYGAKKVPKGASTRNFALLSATEQRDSVRKLKASGMTDEAVAQLTGLGKLEVHAYWRMKMGLFGPSHEEREALEALAAERRRQERRQWIGKTIIASQTKEVKFITKGVSSTAWWREAEIVKAEPACGIVTAVGERTVNIDNQWYETDDSKPGGIRIVEVL